MALTVILGICIFRLFESSPRVQRGFAILSALTIYFLYCVIYCHRSECVNAWNQIHEEISRNGISDPKSFNCKSIFKVENEMPELIKSYTPISNAMLHFILSRFYETCSWRLCFLTNDGLDEEFTLLPDARNNIIKRWKKKIPDGKVQYMEGDGYYYIR